ncbi:16S rRNA (guanine(966)-N(2))-methyltransferase RsmD [Mesoaciditoga lauensis]|uniref:16S rRNA (guanine(966)-N(2))-methyltransferase RsmD n=1 Tax=Mesoaciditoga lauensis TaxID=1495039 RepID=UPI00068AD184|nr:16S rRNA (guanine(966)-N(2))-methyltransferase RsmD [Mesoaciditoga lauensis]
MNLKVTGGKYKGITISSVKDKRTRYTPAIVREALYDIISVANKSVLELFGGSGIVSIEALSREAKEATIVEIAKSSCWAIRKNLEKVHSKAIVMNVDFRIAMRRLEEKGKNFDIIFMDPPFGTGLTFEAFKSLDRHNALLKEDGIGIIESFEKEMPPSQGENIFLEKRKRYGDVILSFYKRGVEVENKGDN